MLGKKKKRKQKTQNKQNQKKPEKTGVFSLLSFSRMSNVMFTASAIPTVTTMPLAGRLVIPVALMDAVPG